MRNSSKMDVIPWETQSTQKNLMNVIMRKQRRKKRRKRKIGQKIRAGMEGCQDNIHLVRHCKNQIGQRLKVFCRLAGRGPITALPLDLSPPSRLSALFFGTEMILTLCARGRQLITWRNAFL
jgi:hypothetical protein